MKLQHTFFVLILMLFSAVFTPLSAQDELFSDYEGNYYTTNRNGDTELYQFYFSAEGFVVKKCIHKRGIEDCFHLGVVENIIREERFPQFANVHFKNQQAAEIPELTFRTDNEGYKELIVYEYDTAYKRWRVTTYQSAW